MTPAFSRRTGLKLWIVRGLFALVLGDAALGIYYWQSLAAHPAGEKRAFENLRAYHDEYARDVNRAEEIQSSLSKVQGECGRFFQEEFLNSSTGYSTVVADLGSIAKMASLPPSTVAFKQHELEKRGVVEVEVTATVEGGYPALVRFVNGLERSERLYLLDSLSLAVAQDKRVKLSLVMRTYFRMAG